MALTVQSDADPILKFKTSAGCGYEGARGLLFFVGKGTNKRSSVMFLRDSQGQPMFVRAVDAQTSFEFGTTNLT